MSFAITSGKGFHVTLANGWTVSVQFGYGNYCERRDLPNNRGAYEHSSENAEIAAFPPGGELYDFGGDTVKGYVSADEVVEFMAKVAAFPAAKP